MTPARIRINGAFHGQTVTGQQRYATEVARQLVTVKAGSAYERWPGPWWSAKSLRAWLWSQTVGVGRSSGELLLTLSSRGPLAARRHVIVVHDLFVFTHPEWFSRRYVWSHIPVLWLQIFTAHAIVAVSGPVAEQVQALTKGRKEVFVAPNAPSEVFLQDLTPHDAPQPTLDRMGLKAGQFILAVGSLDPRKNLERLVEAHMTLPARVRASHPLVIVGGRNPATGEVSLPEVPDIRLLGRISDQELATLYATSSLVAFPTLDEGFGLPAVEALAAGASLLVSDIPVMHWVCREFASYVDPLSVDGIARGLQQAISVSPGSAEDRAARRQYVAFRFSWEMTVNAIVEGIETLSSASAARVAAKECV